MSKIEKEKIMKFRSLRVTLAIAFLALSAVILLIASGLDIYFNLQTQQALIANQQQLIAREAANSVKDFVQKKFGVLEGANSIGNLAVTHHEAQELVLEKLLGLEPAFRQLVLVNIQGKELVRISRLSGFAMDQLTEQVEGDLFLKASKEKRYIGSIYIDKITSEPLVIMAVPITDTFGDCKGILMAEVNLKFMWDLVGNMRIGKNGLAYVVDRQGNLIAFGDISRVLGRGNLAHLEEVNEFIHGNELVHENSSEISRGIQDTYVLTTHAHLGMPDWAVVVELPVLEAYETVIMALKLSVLIMLLSFALAIVAGIYLSKRITKPIINLRDATGKISKGNLDTKIEVQSRDEIGELATSFNQMVEDSNKTTVSRDSLIKEVDQRKRTEDALKESEKRFQDVALSSANWIWEVDRKTRYTYTSGNVKEILGYDPGEIIGKTPFEVSLKDEKGEIQEYFKKIGTEKKPIVDFENWNVTKEGKEVCLLTNGVPILGEKGELLGYRGVEKDITDRKRVEKELKRAMEELARSNTELEQFAYVASHDLREPLRKVGSYTEMLARRYKDQLDAKANKFIGYIMDGTTRMQGLINDLLKYSRVGRDGDSLEPTNFGDVISQVISDLEAAIQENGAVVTHDALPTVMGNASQLTQLFQNLIGNAIKFRGEHPPHIHVSAERIGKSAIRNRIVSNLKFSGFC